MVGESSKFLCVRVRILCVCVYLNCYVCTDGWTTRYPFSRVIDRGPAPQRERERDVNTQRRNNGVQEREERKKMVMAAGLDFGSGTGKLHLHLVVVVMMVMAEEEGGKLGEFSAGNFGTKGIVDGNCI